MSYFDLSCVAADKSVVDGSESYAVIVNGQLLPGRFRSRQQAAAHMGEMQSILAKVHKVMADQESGQSLTFADEKQAVA